MEEMNWIVSASNQNQDEWVDMARTWHPSVALQTKEALEDLGLQCRILHQVGNVRLRKELTWGQALEMGKFLEEIEEQDVDLPDYDH